MTTRVWNVDGAVGFESVNPQGTAVLMDGLLELRSARVELVQDGDKVEAVHREFS